MPAYEFIFPKDAYSVKLKNKDSQVEIPIDIDAMGFTRTGEDGAVKVLPLFGGDEDYGEVLEGHWKKFWDANINADQAFTAILDGSGTLEFEGEADVAGTWGNGGVLSQLPLPLLDELEIQFSMQVPVDDTGSTASRDIDFRFYLRGEKTAQNPISDTDDLVFYISVDEDGLALIIIKEIAGVQTTVASGYDYTMDTTRSTGDLEGVIWRVVFHDGVYGVASPQDKKHMHVYLKQSDTIANAESENEYEVTGSPFAIYDLLFEVAYPAFLIRSQNTTYFDNGGEAKSTYVKVDYVKDIEPIYECDPADQLLNEVEIWDGEPGNGGVKVYDKDHTFSNDPYIRNGLLQYHFDEGVANGLKPMLYDDGSYSVFTTSHYFKVGSISLSYPRFQKIVEISPEKVTVRVKVSGITDIDSVYIMVNITLKRGSYNFEYLLIENVLPDPVDYYVRLYPEARFGYVGDGLIGDDNLNISAQNTTMTDNFFLSFDYELGVGDPKILFLASNMKPSNGFYSQDGQHIAFIDILDLLIGSFKIYMGCIPFSLIANLFCEAETAPCTTDGDDVVDATASGGFKVELDANGEYVYYARTAGTHLPQGRYLAVWRAKIDVATGSDVYCYVRNITDGEHRGEENVYVVKSLTTDWVFYTMVFDITAEDATGGDNIRAGFVKDNANGDVVDLDYVLYIPIGDGADFPQDLAHNALRVFDKARRIVKK